MSVIVYSRNTYFFKFEFFQLMSYEVHSNVTLCKCKHFQKLHFLENHN